MDCHRCSMDVKKNETLFPTVGNKTTVLGRGSARGAARGGAVENVSMDLDKNPLKNNEHP